MRDVRGWLLGLLLSLCAASPAAQAVTDSRGKEVSLASPARRIVSLSPHITEQLFAVGAGGQVVGAVEWSDYPAAARTIPRVGSSSLINIEVVLRLEPDLVVVWRSGNGEEVASRLEALGLTVYLQEPRSLDDIPRELVNLGRLTGHGEEAEAVGAGFQRRIEALRHTYSTRQKVRVFQQIWNRPMITLNGEHLVSDVIRLCGGVNIFADAPSLVVNTSLESILLKDPQVIVVSEADGVPPDWVEDWRQWPSISAVANDQLYVLDPDILHRHTPRIAEGAELMCEFIDRARRARNEGLPAG